MDELGMMIYQDGQKQSFGKLLPISDPNYVKHDKAFEEEILTSSKFKNSNLAYDVNQHFHRNLVGLALQNQIVFLIRDGGILSYVTSNPTLEQINTILTDERINSIPEQEVFEFIDEYDFIDHSSMQEYANTKLAEMKNHSSHIV